MAIVWAADGQVSVLPAAQLGVGLDIKIMIKGCHEYHLQRISEL